MMAAATTDPLESQWRKHMPEGEWVPDISVLACMVCKGEFSFWNRKHHCRRCGAVVCDACSNHRTRHIHRDMTKTSEQEARVCDLCIQVIDAKISAGVRRRLGFADNNPVSEDSPSEQDKTAAIFAPQKAERNGRAVVTMGRYRAEIKESEGNRYIRDSDL
ncbi:unnamed protein product [Aphanomyces euteiches]|uniref:FYVE-type domain-containing protein n=1 Tax=Aphanomyces euteiches TaxID=100861 RepID=A0A6G0WKZ7_9STRA|nr:hypothetical protein Ae201684_014081 [Aphanomyces euteiches]KAH9145577.1 hypothetical protein AeRB84_010508 [Aphanomyces euteiches]